MINKLVAATGMVTALLVTGPANAEIDLSTAEGQVAAMRKVQCSTEDGKAETYWWHGRAYARVRGMRDKTLFQVEGMNIRQCKTVQDETRGPGARLVSREILLYKDPRTGEVIDTWENPYTGETVDVLHVANDPVNNTIFVTNRDGSLRSFPATFKDGQFWMTFEVPLFYHNPLGGDYQKYVGGTYHATEMFNFYGDEADLLNEDDDSAEIRVGWARMSDWLPWMEMNGREGVIYMHTAGRKLDSYDDLPEAFKDLIDERWPEYASPPPLDDDRENETSWTYFKKIMDSKE